MEKTKTHAVALDWRSVAAHVQALTIPAAIKPGGTLLISHYHLTLRSSAPRFRIIPLGEQRGMAHLRLAELNSSEEEGVWAVYRAWRRVTLLVSALPRTWRADGQ